MRQIRWIGATLMLLGVLLPASPTRAQGSNGATGLPTDGEPLCGVAVAPVGATPLPDDGELRVATFNVLHSETDDGDVSLGARLPLLAAAIVDSRADVVGAQEVTRNLELDAGDEYPQKHGLVAERLAQAIAALTGEPWSWCWSRSNPHVPLTPDINVGGGNPLDDAAAANGNFPDSGDFSEGLAIFSRFPIVETRFRRLTPRTYEAPACTDPNPFCPLDATFDSRQVLWAQVDTGAAGKLDMFTTHLAHHLTALSDETKTLQAQQVAAITSEWATDDTLPDFLVGDLNSTPESAAIQATADAGFVDTYAAAGGTECNPEVGAPGCSGGPPEGDEVFSDGRTRTMSERIDYVLARPPTGCTLDLPASEVIGNEPHPLGDAQWLWPSDHLGFVSTTSCAADDEETTAFGSASPTSLGAALAARGARDSGGKVFEYAAGQASAAGFGTADAGTLRLSSSAGRRESLWWVVALLAGVLATAPGRRKVRPRRR
ncbi:MAG: endonuclease/exonuclease/phosphatase family protein [Microthrixaceae bacterium]